MDTYLVKEVVKHRLFIKYVFSGSVITIAELLLFNYLYRFCAWPYLYASDFSFALGIIVSFFARKIWVFNNHDWRDAIKEFYLYSFILLVNVGLNTVLMYYFVEIVNIPKVLGMLCSGAALGLISYAFNKAVTFKRVHDVRLNLPKQISDIKKAAHEK